MSSIPNNTFAFRVDPAHNICSLAKSGLKCGPASRLSKSGIPEETAMAQIKNWAIPSLCDLFHPRLYYWREERFMDDPAYNSLRPQNLWLRQAMKEGRVASYNGRLAIRFPLSLLPSRTCYPDGYFNLQSAYYAVFPTNKDGDIVVPGNQLQVRNGKRWFKISTYLLISWFIPFKGKQLPCIR
jgi:hypothetical protein